MHKFDVTVCLYSGVLTDVFSGKATLFQKLGIETRSRKNWQYELKQIFSFIRENISDIFLIVNLPLLSFCSVKRASLLVVASVACSSSSRTFNLIGPYGRVSTLFFGLGSIVNFICSLFSQPIPWYLPRTTRSPVSRRRSVNNPTRKKKKKTRQPGYISRISGLIWVKSGMKK